MPFRARWPLGSDDSRYAQAVEHEQGAATLVWTLARPNRYDDASEDAETVAQRVEAFADGGPPLFVDMPHPTLAALVQHLALAGAAWRRALTTNVDDVNHRDVHGLTALYHALLARDDARALALLERGADPTFRYPARASGTERMDIAFVDVQNSALHLAMRCGLPVVRALLAHGAGPRTSVERLLAAGSDRTVRDVDGHTALDLARRHHRADLVELLA